MNCCPFTQLGLSKDGFSEGELEKGWKDRRRFHPDSHREGGTDEFIRTRKCYDLLRDHHLRNIFIAELESGSLEDAWEATRIRERDLFLLRACQSNEEFQQVISRLDPYRSRRLLHVGATVARNELGLAEIVHGAAWIETMEKTVSMKLNAGQGMGEAGERNVRLPGTLKETAASASVELKPERTEQVGRKKKRACRTCGKEYFILDSLRRHEKTHNPTKSCHVCKKLFSRADVLTMHLKTHQKNR